MIEGEIGSDFKYLRDINVGLGEANFGDPQLAVVDGFEAINLSERGLEGNDLGVDVEGLEVFNMFLYDGVDVFDGDVWLFEHFGNILGEEIPAGVLGVVVVDFQGCHAEHYYQDHDDDLLYCGV